MLDTLDRRPGRNCRHVVHRATAAEAFPFRYAVNGSRAPGFLLRGVKCHRVAEALRLARYPRSEHCVVLWEARRQ